MNHSIGYLVPIPSLFHNAFDGPVYTEKVLHLPDVLCLLDHQVVFVRKLQRLLETNVLLPGQQETQTQTGQRQMARRLHILQPLRHRRGDELHCIRLVVGRGGEDQSLAPQVFVSTSGDVIFDGLATLWRVDAKGGVLLGELIDSLAKNCVGC